MRCCALLRCKSRGGNNVYWTRTFWKKNHTIKMTSNETLSGACDHLRKTIGTIEYELALNNMNKEMYDEAIKLYKLSASHGNPSAIFNLGVCYQRGIGVPTDLKIAYECYKKAASMGHQKAIHNANAFDIGFKRKKVVGTLSK